MSVAAFGNFEEELQQERYDDDCDPDGAENFPGVEQQRGKAADNGCRKDAQMDFVAEALFIAGILSAVLSGIIDLILSANHRGDYWAAFRYRLGFWLLLGAVFGTVAWLQGAVPTLIITLAATCLIGYGGSYLFERRGKLPTTLTRRLRKTVPALGGIGIILALLPLLL